MTPKASIPRVIHRVWIGADMPDEFAEFAEQWEHLNPGWRVRHWDEAAIDKMRLHNQALYDDPPCPERYRPRFRSNLVRYELLERHGGVYVDCDLRPLAPLPDLDGIEAFAGWEAQGEWIGNTILGATKGHPFFAALVDGAAESCREYGPERSPVTTGPQYLTRTWRAHEAAGGSGVYVFDEPVFYPRSWRDLNDDPVPLPPEAVTDHLWAALRGSVSVVIPYRPDGAERDRNLAWVTARLRDEHPDWQIVVQTEPEGERHGLFNRAALIRAGVERSFGDILVIHDGDCWCPGLPAAVDNVRKGARWSRPHDLVHRLTPDATVDVLGGAELRPGLAYDEKPYPGCITGGVVVVRRDLFHECPPDDRFVGWGGEDQAWGTALLTLCGAVWSPHERLYHLWHPYPPRMSRDVGNEANQALLGRYLSAANDREAMAALVAEHTIGAEPVALPASPSGWWRHTRTGQLRHASHRGAQRLARDPQWEPTEAPA